MTEQDRTDAALKSLRTQLDDLRALQPEHRRHATFTAMASAHAVALLVLSSNVWFVHDYDDDHVEYTPWHQPPEVNWFGSAAMTLLVVLAVVSLVLTWSDVSGHRFHWSLAGAGALAGFSVLSLATQLDQYTYTAPAFWFTVLGALTLAAVHGIRGDQLSRY